MACPLHSCPTIAYRVRRDLDRRWNCRRRLQFQKGHSRCPQDLQVLARVRREGQVCPGPFFKSPLGIRYSVGPAFFRAGQAMASLRCGPSETNAQWTLQSKGIGDRVDWVLARAENLPFRDDCFGSASISLALRNVSDAQSTFREMSRATGPGGVVISLDFARPRNRVFQLFYYDYLLGIFPLFGRMISEAWGRTLSYLGRSILRARTGEQIANLLREEGIADAVSVPLTAGIVCAVYGTKRWHTSLALKRAKRLGGTGQSGNNSAGEEDESKGEKNDSSYQIQQPSGHSHQIVVGDC